MTPALAVADELIEIGYSNILWVGHKRSQTGDRNLSAEYREVARRNIRFITLHTGKIWRRWTFATFDKALLNLIKIPFGFFQAFLILILYRPSIIMSFGGYLSVPLVLNFLPNRFNKTKIYIHSQTIRPDLSIRLTNRFAKKLFLTWENAKRYYKHKNIEVVGTPLNKFLLEPVKSDGGDKLFDNDLPILLVMGGNQGANTFNRRLNPPILEKYLKIFNVIHQTGSSTVTNDYQKALANKEHLEDPFKSRYLVLPYILPEQLNQVYAQASLILARSGANTVQEIMFKGVPAILMPIPWSQNNEQLENAKIAERTGLAKLFEFKDGLKPESLFREISLGLEQIQKRESFKADTSWVKAKQKANALIKTDSVKRILAAIEEIHVI